MKKDPELLRCYVEEKSEPAFAELVQRHLPSVYGAALRRVGGDAHLAKDVAQHVFTALAREAETLARRPVLAGWLHDPRQHCRLPGPFAVPVDVSESVAGEL